MFEISQDNRDNLLVLESENVDRIISEPLRGQRGIAFIPDPVSFLGGWRPIGECFANTLQSVLFYPQIGWVFDVETAALVALSSTPNFGLVFSKASHTSERLDITTSRHQIGWMFVGNLGGWIHVGN